MASGDRRQRSAGGTVALVLHSASHSGPARNFASRFRLTDRRLHVYAPAQGPALELYREFAETHVAPYERLIMPRSGRAAGRAAVALTRDLVTFRRLFRDHGVELVVSATTVTPAAALAARTLGLTSVIYCGELFDTRRSSPLGRRLSAQAMTATVPRLADLVICCSNRAAEQFGGRGRATVVRLYPPIDRDGSALDALDARERFGLPSEGPVVVTIGLLSPGRGQDVAISALARLRERPNPPVLAVAGEPGEGPGDRRYARGLVEFAASAGLESAVHFLGPVSDVPALLTAADVFVNPARYEEPFGRAALEAVAHGVPAIITRTGAQTELLRDEHSALAVPPDDPAAVARSIERILDSPALAERLVQGAAGTLRELDPELDRARFRQLLDSAA